MTPYQKVENLFNRINALEHLLSLGFWDEACMMPEGGSAKRAAAMAETRAIINEWLSTKETSLLIKDSENQLEALSNWQKANLNEIKRRVLSESCYSQEFVKDMVTTRAQSEQAWRIYRKANDWQSYLPFFERVVTNARRQAQILGQTFDLKPYDALVDCYEAGLTSDRIAEIFAPLKDQLPDLVNMVIERQRGLRKPPPQGHFPIEKQRQLGLQVMGILGFNFNHGRLDISHHPFCGGDAEDVRITTRYREHEFLQSLMGIIHETGHALYEQHRPKAWLTQPVSQARSMGVHEGQSLLFELQVGRSQEFIRFLTPLIEKTFAENAPGFTFDQDTLVRLVQQVDRGFIRVEADEVTYPLHVILRFEIEKALIEEDIEAKDLPSIWNEKMIQYLGLSTLGQDDNGCMQDVHWPSGLFGYFPSYTIGAMIAAQVFRKANQHVPTLMSQIQQGELGELRQFVHDRIWSQGSLMLTDDLMVHATGETLNGKYLLEHLRKRYGATP